MLLSLIVSGVGPPFLSGRALWGSYPRDFGLPSALCCWSHRFQVCSLPDLLPNELFLCLLIPLPEGTFVADVVGRCWLGPK